MRAWQAPPSASGTWKIIKKMQKGGPGAFWFDKGGAEGFSHI